MTPPPSARLRCGPLRSTISGESRVRGPGRPSALAQLGAFMLFPRRTLALLACFAAIGCGPDDLTSPIESQDIRFTVRDPPRV